VFVIITWIVARARNFSPSRRLCGLHVQVMSSAELTLWGRIDSLRSPSRAARALAGPLVGQTWAMRGTLHLLPSSELPMWHAELGTSPRFL
jgi:hypothetical protein